MSFNSGTSVPPETLAIFRAHLKDIAAHLEPSAIDAFSIRRFDGPWRAALKHGLRDEQWVSSEVVLDRYDDKRKPGAFGLPLCGRRASVCLPVVGRGRGAPPHQGALARHLWRPHGLRTPGLVVGAPQRLGLARRPPLSVGRRLAPQHPHRVRAARRGAQVRIPQGTHRRQAPAHAHASPG
ncbi:hypothetical protein GCM10025876_25670 [Demequina litorisediminis]|uniref:Uncharacterized protein n=1 Tax=Demequina litorisediminis TaxID=1849022 RepID=A0ABQ6II20_9MICO|nr:hypothetical protein GCM10025876_25670 [Demequina litorisediminis]